MLDAFMLIFNFIIKALYYIILGLCACSVPFILSGWLWFIFYFWKGMRLPKRQTLPTKIKNNSILARLFILFPRQFILDLFHRNPDAFPHHGLHLFCGEQGAGKTLAMIHFADTLKKKYPLANVRANFKVEFADKQINSIDDIIFQSNGELGEVQMIDEIQTWFNSLESKNFPIEMIQEICQQRKQRKIILGTSQVFTRVAKPIREQTMLIYEPITILGCMTIVRVSKPSLDENGGVLKKRRVKMYFFVHNEYLRNCYDTYEKIERLNKKGFKPTNEQIQSPSPISTIKISNK